MSRMPWKQTALLSSLCKHLKGPKDMVPSNEMQIMAHGVHRQSCRTRKLKHGDFFFRLEACKNVCSFL